MALLAVGVLAPLTHHAVAQSGSSCCTIAAPGQFTESVLAPADFDQFGKAVVIDGELLIVSEQSKDHSILRTDAGEVHVYRWDSTAARFLHLESFVSDSADESALFGHDVDLDAGRLIVGSNGHGGFGQPAGGLAEVFTYDPANGGSFGAAVAILPSLYSAGDEFGHSVAIDGDYAMVSSHKRGNGVGAVFVFHHDGTGWAQTQMITPPASITAAMEFGWSLAMDGPHAVIGAPGDPNSPNPALYDPGHVTFWKRSGAGQYVQEGIALQAPQGADDGDFFGKSVAIDGTTVAVGAPGNGLGGAHSGAVFVFKRDTSGAPSPPWIPVGGALLACDPARQLKMGWSVSLDGDVLVAGARERLMPEFATAHVLRRHGAAWLLHRTLEGGPIAGIPGHFGWDVAVQGDRIVVTDPRFDEPSPTGLKEVGAIYQFVAAFGTDPSCACPTDLDADGATGIDDVVLLMAAWGPCVACTADMTGDDEVDAADLQMLFDAFGPCDDQGTVAPPQSLLDCLAQYSECPRLCACIDAVLQLGSGS